MTITSFGRLDTAVILFDVMGASGADSHLGGPEWNLDTFTETQ